MLRRTLVYLRQNILGLLALIVALGTGTAYAADTVFSTDIVDGQVKSVDIGDGEIGSADVKDNSINTFDVHSFLGQDVVDGTLTGADVANTSSLGSPDIGEEGLLFNNTLNIGDIGSGAVGADEVLNDSLLQSDIRAGAVTNDEVLDNSLIGADIDESTLTSTAKVTFAFVTPTSLPNNGTLVKVASKNLPGGAYALFAHANLDSAFPFNGDLVRTASCELRSGGTFIGGATDRRVLPDDDNVQRNLSMSGGAQVPGGGGEVSLWCSSQAGSDSASSGHILILSLGGFF